MPTEPVESNPPTQPPRLSLGVVFSVLGSLLIGAGLLTLIAHNYSEMNNAIRTVVSLIPLLIAIGLTYFGLKNNKADHPVWAEGVSIFYLSAIGIAISMIGQTYHIQGDWIAMLFRWVLLGLPIIYLFNSLSAILIVGLGIFIYRLNHLFSFETPILVHWVFWICWLAVLIAFVLHLKNSRRLQLAHYLAAWLLSILTIIIVAVDVHRWTESITYIALACLCIYLIGVNFLYQYPRTINSLRSVGFIGFILALFALKHVDEETTWQFADLFIAVALVLSILALPKRRHVGIQPLMVAVFPVLILLLRLPALPFLYLLIDSLLLAAFFGIVALFDGRRLGRIWQVLIGIFIILGALSTHFFDGDVGFTIKGIVFVIFGIIFLGLIRFTSTQPQLD